MLDGKKQFTIPIYQRTYSWQIKQCQQLFDDILRVGQDDAEPTHFIGSVVYFKPNNSPVTSVPELLVIDGQQRLTTVSLLLLALVHFLKHNPSIHLGNESWEEIYDTYIVNRHRKDSSRLKLSLTKKDRETYGRLVDEIELEADYSRHIAENYYFFVEKIQGHNVHSVYYGIKKLIIVDVILERDKDNPQLIFESLNSTGLDLSQADLIRNYVLMGQPAEKQRELYEKYWYPMEQRFGENIDSLGWFIRDYLTMMEASIPRIGHVYEAYKRFLPSKKGFDSVEEAVKSLHRYAKYYVRIALIKEQDPVLLKRFKEITKLKVDTSFPFLLAVYNDYEGGRISKEEISEIVTIVINYVFRRAVCGIPTNSLNKTFATIYKQIKHDAYLESVKAAFLLMDGYRRFPTDAEFAKELQIKDVYNFRLRNYLLESLENWNKRELVNAENYTIEHILPQNPNLSLQWQAELGDEWENVKEKYLHTLGNLTLTGYNSELSDRSFGDKKNIEGGFNSSPLFLNESVRCEEVWDQRAITTRAKKLAEKACIVWGKPTLTEDRLNLYREPELSENVNNYNANHYEHLQGEVLDLYNRLEKRVLNLDSAIRVEFKKLYIAFKSQTNFLDVVPQKKRLRLSLNIEYHKIRDPKGICKDVSELGRWGNGDVEVGLENQDGLDYIMDLVEQAFEEQVESV